MAKPGGPLLIDRATVPPLSPRDLVLAFIAGAFIGAMVVSLIWLAAT